MRAEAAILREYSVTWHLKIIKTIKIHFLVLCMINWNLNKLSECLNGKDWSSKISLWLLVLYLDIHFRNQIPRSPYTNETIPRSGHCTDFTTERKHRLSFCTIWSVAAILNSKAWLFIHRGNFSRSSVDKLNISLVQQTGARESKVNQHQKPQTVRNRDVTD